MNLRYCNKTDMLVIIYIYIYQLMYILWGGVLDVKCVKCCHSSQSQEHTFHIHDVTQQQQN